MSVFPVVKGLRLRATKINNCGLPQAGPINRLVTDGFVTVNMTAVMNDAEELEQKNAEGKVCVIDRTPPTRKYYTPVVTLCNVNTELISMFNGWDQVLDYADNPIGFDDKTDVDGDYGVAIEVWTGGRSDSDCPTPTLDTIFSVGSSGKHYGYLLFGGTEWVLGDIEIGAQVSTFTLTGRTVAMPQWGRGPYNVAGTDANGTPGRMLTPMTEDNHYRLFRTPVPPPDVTGNGGTAVALDILGKFTGTTYYFGGPANAPAADIAPEQDNGGASTALTITGVPTGGGFTLLWNGHETAVIAYNAAAAAVKSALVAMDDGFDASDWTVTGATALPTGPITIIAPFGSVTEGTNTLTGGTTPTVHVDPS